MVVFYNEAVTCLPRQRTKTFTSAVVGLVGIFILYSGKFNSTPGSVIAGGTTHQKKNKERLNIFDPVGMYLVQAISRFGGIS